MGLSDLPSGRIGVMANYRSNRSSAGCSLTARTMAATSPAATALARRIRDQLAQGLDRWVAEAGGGTGPPSGGLRLTASCCGADGWVSRALGENASRC